MPTGSHCWSHEIPDHRALSSNHRQQEHGCSVRSPARSLIKAELGVREQPKSSVRLGGRQPYVFELEEAEVAEVGDGEVRRLGGDDDLHQLHRLRPHQIHRRAAPATAAARHGVRACPAPVSGLPAAPPSDPTRDSGSGSRGRSGSPAVA